MKDFKYTVTREAGKSTLVVEGDGHDDVLKKVEETVAALAGGAVASGREILEFITEFNGGQSNVEEEDKLQDSMGGWLLKLDEVYLLSSFGKISVGEDTWEFAEAMRNWRTKERDSDPRRKSPRYPYTYAADVLRLVGPHERVELAGAPALRAPKLSRSDASELREGLAPVLGVAPHELAEMLANYYLDHEEELVEAQIKGLPPAGE